jgi:nucleoside triphosphate pyrophosphatase
MQFNRTLVLASRSPRRQSLLRQIGLKFETRESGVAEEFPPGQDPHKTVAVLSERKASAVGQSYADAIILGADTVVVIGGALLGKPGDPDEASRMLGLLSGKTHEVLTGITLLDRPSNKRITAVERTRVTFRELSSGEIAEYVSSGSPMDKAGAYGIQDDLGAVFVERVEGCFYNVVGLPLMRFYVTLRDFQKQLEKL